MSKVMMDEVSRLEGSELAVLGGLALRSTAWPKWPAYDADTERVLLDVLRSQRWAISGPYRGQSSYERQFADAYAAFHSVPYCTPVTNGSAGLALTLRALNVGYRDRVIVPGLTWIACATAVTSVGAIPVPADIDLETVAISTVSLEQRLAEGAKAVVLVHPFCRVADLDGALDLCSRYGVPLVEDCSQAHGATWRGRRVGTFGIAGVFSMQQSKVLTAGEGGAVITRSPELAERLEQLRADGRVFNSSRSLNRLELKEIGTVQGRNHCLSEFQSAILLSRLSHLDAENDRRRTNAATLDLELAAIPGVRPMPPQPGVNPTYYNYLFRVTPEAFAGRTVEEIAFAISAELSLQASPIYRPIHAHRLFNYRSDPLLRPLRDEFDTLFARYATELPNCVIAREEFITIPHVALLGGEQEVADICGAIRKVQRHSRLLKPIEDGNVAF